ncbi:putative bromodomain-containing protein [Cucumis melo var. makuwa]|uniref:Bromodomain-containing protein n=1 Tax=Cucumis melo var. makuwa TaxID=1194695 RepID=A0A5A7UK37_CUCMM|nr:putative bromodomain-containing protein [Cucumis melo var. makuwa]
MYCGGKASPDRLYRTALLRNRFADTILKAREKALKKGDKRDLEKVKMEREELERQQREGWRRATNGGRLKLKLRPWRRMTARDSNDDGMDGGELRTAMNVSLFSEPFPFCFQFCVKQKRNKYSEDLSTHYLQRRKNLDLSRRTTYGIGKT